MKILTSLPSNKEFFDTYAPLSGTITWAGIFAQLVSGLTEFGIIYTGSQHALDPLHLGVWTKFISLAVAILGTATIELGLRQTFPKAIDSILYSRWKDLHLPISFFVWLLSLVLLITSGLLSFKNSYVIVENFTPEVSLQTTHTIDSSYLSEQNKIRASYINDSLLIEKTSLTKQESTINSFDKKIASERQAIIGYENKEARTNKSYATRKDRIRQKIADLEADKAMEISQLTNEKNNTLVTLRSNNKKELAKVKENHTKEITKVDRVNKEAQSGRTALVNNYGGGLGWFTVVCLFIFAVSVILDRIYRKGAGIKETIQIESYDFRPSASKEWFYSIRERINYLMHHKVKLFADKTPAAPLPAQPGVVYDLSAALKHTEYKLQLVSNEKNEKVLNLNTKEPELSNTKQLRQMGFKQQKTATVSCDLYSPPNFENEPTKNSYETVDLRLAKQRLKRYKKRLGSHQQKAIKQEKNLGKVYKRTSDAIANNQEWVSYWERVVQKLSTKAD